MTMMKYTLSLLLLFFAHCWATTIVEYCDDPEVPNVCPFSLTGKVSNVALHKSAAQSTQYKHGGAPELAVDGNTNQKFWEAKSCSHTAEHIVQNETVPWFRVDFGTPHLIKNVRLYSRNDPCCADRYHDIQVRLGLEKEEGLGVQFSRNPLCNELVGGGKKQGEILNFDCSPCHAGRYLTVQIVRNCENCKLPEYNILSICELEAMGYAV